MVHPFLSMIVRSVSGRGRSADRSGFERVRLMGGSADRAQHSGRRLAWWLSAGLLVVAASCGSDEQDGAVVADAIVDGDSPDVVDDDIAAEDGTGGDATTEVDVLPPVDAELDAGPECSTDEDCVGQVALVVCQVVRCTDGACEAATAPDGTGCDDGDACTLETVCAEGTCGGGTEKDCEDGNPCTADWCEAGTCQKAIDNEASCSDDNACTEGDMCFNGACLGGDNVCPEDCSNLQDDNGDDLVDCDDPKCAAFQACLQQCVLNDSLQCGDSLTVDLSTIAATQAISSWPCTTEATDGKEWGWQIAVVEPVAVTVTVAGAPDGASLLHLADPTGGGCKPQYCVDRAAPTDGVVFDAIPESPHHVVLDTAAPGDSSEVTITVQCTVCQPDCAGRNCGSDGCGGNCGTCTGATSCVDGTCVSPPANDVCLDAIELPTSNPPVFVQGTTRAADDDASIPADAACAGAGGFTMGLLASDVFYRFVPPASGDYLFAVHADFDAEIYVIGSCSDPGASCIGADNSASGTADVVTVTLSMGVPVWIVVDGHGLTARGDFTLSWNTAPCTASCGGKSCGPDGCGGSCGGCASGYVCTTLGTCAVPAPNDTCLEPLDITQVPYTGSHATVSAADDITTLPEVCPGGPAIAEAGVGAPDLVFRFTPPSNGKYRARVIPAAGFDALLTARVACPGTTQQCLAGSDVAGDGEESVEFVRGAGDAVWLVVDGSAEGDLGLFDLEITQLPCTPDCDGKVCGDNGCGGTCGPCSAGEVCTEAGACVEVPSNDLCAAATVIPSLPWVGGGTVVGATSDYEVAPNVCTDGPTSATYGTGPDVAFVYTSPVAQSVLAQFDKNQTDFITYLVAASDCDELAAGCTASFVSTTPGGSTLAIHLQAGETVYWIVSGWSPANEGEFVLQVSAQ